MAAIAPYADKRRQEPVPPADARERRDVSDDNSRPRSDQQRLCERCGETLRSALHLPARVGQPAYDIFRCVACGFIEWVAHGSEPQP